MATTTVTQLEEPESSEAVPYIDSKPLTRDGYPAGPPYPQSSSTWEGYSDEGGGSYAGGVLGDELAAPYLAGLDAAQLALYRTWYDALTGGEALARESATWNEEARRVGDLSPDGHVFCFQSRQTPQAKARQYNLKPIVVLLESRLRRKGVHTYNITVNGSLGKAGGLGFVFHDVLQRRNISSIPAVFLNRAGQLCCRSNGTRVSVASEPLIPLNNGVQVQFKIDLTHLRAQFEVQAPNGMVATTSIVSLWDVVPQSMIRNGDASGFFSAVVQDTATLYLF
eukprot:TRINITY_DN24047_c0_g1_i1.p1 TRINITY_DN24047_c0_g1~~TRINITY_DN24047_c0_g1_i1.p1  ORF type:complete len:281 (-),score=62.69 TRINITY_DN24047_c0_g1_i1:424-1266(-)